ncbi:MAG: hypothetical protein QXO33_04195, partial [Nitrososphaeria archaeon]
TPPVKRSRNKWDKYPVKYAKEIDKKLFTLKKYFNIKISIKKENIGTKTLCKIFRCLTFRSQSGNIVPKKEATIIDKKSNKLSYHKILIDNPNAKIICVVFSTIKSFN